MNKYEKMTPQGTRDLLFEECDIRRNIETGLSAMFKSRGYKTVITPTLEFFDVFNRPSAGMKPEDIYILPDYAGRLMVLRPDSTMPIARIAATRLRNADLPLRLYYNQRVFRRAKSYSGHSDEATQSGIELIGSNGLSADLEVIVTALDALERCGTGDFRLEICHAGFYKALIGSLRADKEKTEAISELIETKNFAALNDLLSELPENDAARVLRDLPRLFGGREVLEKAAALCEKEEELAPLRYLDELYCKLSQIGLEDKISIDLGLVHRNNYYTGVVFRGFVEGSGLTVLSGGRYDKLIGEFGRNLPAIGFGVEIDALAAVALNGELKPAPAPDVLIYGEKGCEAQAIAHMRLLTQQGLICENSLATSEASAVKYAKGIGIKRMDSVSETGVTTKRID